MSSSICALSIFSTDCVWLLHAWQCISLIFIFGDALVVCRRDRERLTGGLEGEGVEDVEERVERQRGGRR